MRERTRWPAIQGSFRSPSHSASSRKLPHSLTFLSSTLAPRPLFCVPEPPAPFHQHTCHIMGTVASHLLPSLAGVSGGAKPSVPGTFRGHMTSHGLPPFEYPDQTRDCIFFQRTLQTAGEGKKKSPQRAQRMRHVHRKGLEGLGRDGHTGWTSWSETLKLNVPIHFGSP